MKNNKHRAFLKWAGGKYSLVDDIKQQLPAGRKLVEPFVGAGSVFLNTDYDRYLLCDINQDLINLYQLVKKKPQAFLAEAETLFSPKYNQESEYYALRNEFNLSSDPFRRSVLFLYLNRHGYNGLCRYNRSGGFNVPFGRYKAPYFPAEEILYFSQKAKRATFECIDFRKSFARARKGSVVYCDPPYVPISATANFTGYAALGFSLQQQKQLASLARDAAAKRGVPVLLSNHDTEFTRGIYSEAELTELKVARFISQKGHSRKKVSELLALYQVPLIADNDVNKQHNRSNKSCENA